MASMLVVFYPLGQESGLARKAFCTGQGIRRQCEQRWNDLQVLGLSGAWSGSEVAVWRIGSLPGAHWRDGEDTWLRAGEAGMPSYRRSVLVLPCSVGAPRRAPNGPPPGRSWWEALDGRDSVCVCVCVRKLRGQGIGRDSAAFSLQSLIKVLTDLEQIKGIHAMPLL